MEKAGWFMGKKDLVPFLGFLPLSYVLLIVVGAGSQKSFYGVVVQEGIGDRLVQSLLLSLAVTILIWYFRRGKQMSELSDPTRDAMRFFGKAKDAYSGKGLVEEAKECDLLIAKISHIALDPRIELKF
jgi:hypothetical protein